MMLSHKNDTSRQSIKMEVIMDTRGRKLLCGVAGFLTVAVLMGTAYTTTAMASSIGLIDTADLLDIHAEADGSSEVVGQVMDEGHVAILAKGDGWVQIQAGDIIGWVPDSNLIETEVSNEEAAEANQEVIEDLAEEAEETGSEPAEEESLAEEQATQETQPAEEETDNTETEQTVAETEQTISETEQTVTETGLEETETAAGTTAEIPAGTGLEDAAITEAAESVEAFARNQAIAAQALWEEQQKAQQAAFEAAAAKQAQEAEAAKLQAQAEAQKQAILAANGVTEDDLYLLANIIYCEAGCEPYVGKVAVGNVVMNRVKSDHQPDTISEVVYAKGQFSPVRNGSLKRALQNNSADASCYQAALEALAGSQPVGDKLYFRRVNGRSGQIIGHHVFY